VEGTSERRERQAHRGGDSTCGGGAEAVRRCSDVGGGGLGGWRRRDHSLAPWGEREEGEVGIESTEGEAG
jgi:hypothetical protein